MKPILLATGSRYKISLFSKLGFPFTHAASNVEQDPAPAGLAPTDLALYLAEAKARDFLQSHGSHWIIGADQVLELEGEVLHKPGSPARTVAQLKRLCGRTHYLHTAFCLLDAGSGRKNSGLVSAGLTFYEAPADEQLRAMVEADQSWDCVGGYKLESMGIRLVKKLETSDPNAVVGLPLIALNHILRQWLEKNGS